MTSKIIITLAMSVLLGHFGFAQPDDNEKNEKVEAMKVAFITQKLNLTPAEAKTFWPVFNEFDTELKKIKVKEKENAMTYKAKANPTDQDANAFIKSALSLKQAELDLTSKYVNEFKKVLPESKVAKLLMIEMEFKQMLLQRLKERHEKGDRQNRMER